MGCSCRWRSHSPFDPHKNTLSIRANGWLHSNKQGSDTMPLRQRPDFKQAMSTLHRLQREAEEDPQVSTYSSQTSTMSIEFSFYMVELAVHSWWTPYPSESHDGDAPSIEWTGRLVDCSIWKDSFGIRLSWIQFFLQMDRLQLTAVYCNRRVLQTQHLKWHVFAVRKCAVNGYRKELTITAYSLTTSAQLDQKYKSEYSVIGYVCVVTSHDYTTDTNANMTTKTDVHTEHINTNMWVHTHLSVRASSHCTLHRMAQVMSRVQVLSHDHALMMCAVLPRHWSLFSLHPLLLGILVALLPLLWGS